MGGPGCGVSRDESLLKTDGFLHDALLEFCSKSVFAFLYSNLFRIFQGTRTLVRTFEAAEGPCPEF